MRPSSTRKRTCPTDRLVFDFVFVAFFAHLICLAVATLVVRNNLSNSVVIDFVFVVDFVGILLVCGFALIFALLPLFHTIFCPQTLPLPLP